ncbi:MAG: Gldg family protein [Proteobacteria bacterium]|nr:Gldg family protein [Pseudomonadota bacterium]
MSGLFARIEQLDRSVVSTIGIILAVVLFLSVNLYSILALNGARSDLTEGKLFTLTDSTRQVLADLKEPMTLRLYQSEALLVAVPQLNVYAERVNELLRTYSELSNGLIRFEVVNPVPFSSEEDRAIQFQLRPFQLNAQGENGYFGLVGSNTTDDIETVPFLSPDQEPFLEYELTSMVITLASPRKKVVGVIDGIGVMGRENGPPMALIRQMQQIYDVRTLVFDPEVIPPNADVLMIVHPFNLPVRSQYAIEQHILAGNPAIIFIDPFAENSPTDPQNRNNYLFPTSTLATLLNKWGVEMPDDSVVGDRQMALRISGFGGPNQVVTDYLPWLRIPAEAFNADEAITAGLQLMRMTSAGSLRAAGNDNITLTPLIQSTRDSNMIRTVDIRRRGDPNELLEAFEASGVRQNLAIRISGIVQTAFPDGPPPLQRPDEVAPDFREPDQIIESVQPINVIIVADVDMLADSHVVNPQTGQPASNNADFVINSVETLAGGGALIGLRGRGLSHRPFTTVAEIEDAAREKYFETEQRLSAELDETQRQLAQLQGLNRADVQFELLTQEEQNTIIEFNRRMLTLRQQLRDVRRALGEDIEQLESRLQFYNIVAIPLVVAAFGLGIAVLRRSRLRRARASIRRRA